MRGQHQRPDGGSVAAGQPASRQRPGIVAPFPPRPGANGSRRYPGNPNQWCAGRLCLVDQLPFDQRQPQLPSRETAPEARHPRRLPPLLHVLDDIHRRRPHERRQRPLRQRTPILDRPRRFAVRQPPLRGARQRQRLLALVVRVVDAPRHRSAPSTRPPGTSACRSSPCVSCPGREQRVVDPALEPGLSSLRFSARISPSSSRADAFRPAFFCPSGSSQLLPSDAPRGAARRRPVRKMAALLSSRDGLWNLDRVRGN